MAGRASLVPRTRPRPRPGGRRCRPRPGGGTSGSLPYLLKVLAADEPLSLQARPSPDQARAGFERETAAGLAPDSAERNHMDSFPQARADIRALQSFRRLLRLPRPQGRQGGLRSLRRTLGRPGRRGVRRRARWRGFIASSHATSAQRPPPTSPGVSSVGEATQSRRRPGVEHRPPPGNVLPQRPRHPADASAEPRAAAAGPSALSAAGNIDAYLNAASSESCAASWMGRVSVWIYWA